MTDETIVAVFETAAHAEAAVADLRAAHVPDDAIGLHAGTPQADGLHDDAATAAPREPGFWASLFGGEPEHGAASYDRSLQRGSTVLTVRTPSTHVEQVMRIIERHGPVELEDYAADHDLAPATDLARAPLPAVVSATARTAPAVPAVPATQAVATDADAADVLQLSEESLQVGRRVVNRGGTRIRRYVVETPVEQSVTLHEERVTLERHPVADGRPVAADAFTDKVVEMTETAEEAVVSKTARVVEEVSLRKQASERVETVRDTVRRQEVAVEQLPGTATTATDLPPRPRAPQS